MTVELDNVIKNLNGNALIIELEDDNGDQNVYIGTDNTSGCGYKIQSVQEIGEFVNHYLMTYFADGSEE